MGTYDFKTYRTLSYTRSPGVVYEAVFLDPTITIISFEQTFSVTLSDPCSVTPTVLESSFLEELEEPITEEDRTVRLHSIIGNGSYTYSY